MKNTKRVTLRIPENLDELAALSAEIEHTNKAISLRQWLHKGAGLYVLELIEKGRITTGYGAQILGVTYYDIYSLAETYGIKFGPTEEQRQRSHALVEELSRTKA